MNMKNWIDLINERENEIIEAAEEAYADAMKNKHLRFVVELHEDGDVTTLQDIAGGNSIRMTTFNGSSIEILEFCFQNDDIDMDVFEGFTEDEAIEWEINEYAYSGSMAKLEEKLRQLKDQAEIEEWYQ